MPSIVFRSRVRGSSSSVFLYLLAAIKGRREKICEHIKHSGEDGIVIRLLPFPHIPDQHTAVVVLSKAFYIRRMFLTNILRISFHLNTHPGTGYKIPSL
jgi:hypothetical protein